MAAPFYSLAAPFPRPPQIDLGQISAARACAVLGVGQLGHEPQVARRHPQLRARLRVDGMALADVECIQEPVHVMAVLLVWVAHHQQSRVGLVRHALGAGADAVGEHRRVRADHPLGLVVGQQLLAACHGRNQHTAFAQDRHCVLVGRRRGHKGLNCASYAIGRRHSASILLGRRRGCKRLRLDHMHHAAHASPQHRSELCSARQI